MLSWEVVGVEIKMVVQSNIVNCQRVEVVIGVSNGQFFCVVRLNVDVGKWVELSSICDVMVD